MEQFEQLVSSQMETMDKLLYLQSELERCQEIEQQLMELQKEAELECIKKEIEKMKVDLKEIQLTFESQTAEVIRSYKDIKVSAC